jgi:hypothetical protein
MLAALDTSRGVARSTRFEMSQANTVTRKGSIEQAND